jgi:hypothetical protein
MPVIALIVGVAVLSLAAADYATSPANHRGIRLGPLFFEFPHSAPVAAGKPGAPKGTTPGSGGTTPGVIPWTGNGLKHPIHGLLYLQGVPPQSLRLGLAGYVVQGPGDYGAVSWSELQANPGGPITSNNPIDRAIADVRAWNATNPQHLEVLKVRISAGIHSPAWVKSVGGACVTVKDPNFGVGGCTPRFWTAQFAAAFYQFEAELAARYDRVPEISEVIIARNMTIYNEPLLRQIADPGSVAGLLAAGYTTAADEQNQRTDLATMGRFWKHTRTGFTMNPYQTVNPLGQNEAFTEQLIAYGRQVLGPQLVLENDSLRSSFLTGTGMYAHMYAYMGSLRGPIGFQTAVLRKVGSLNATLDGARRLGASNVELPPGFQAVLSPAQLLAYGAALPIAA